MTDIKNTIQFKMPYEHGPKIIVINLFLDEIMQAGCKNDTAIGNGVATCALTSCQVCGS